MEVFIITLICNNSFCINKDIQAFYKSHLSLNSRGGVYE